MKRLPPELCSECSQLLDAASYIGDERVKPRPGDISLCIRCGHMTVFKDDMHRRELSDEEMHEMAGDPALLKLQRARAMLKP